MNTNTYRAILIGLSAILLLFAGTFGSAEATGQLGLIGKIQSVSGRPFGIDLQGQVIYLSEFDEGSANIQTYSVRDPRHPRLLGSAVTSEQADDIAVRGRHAYVANDGLGLQVLDISNARAPVFVSGRSDGAYANSVSLARLPPTCSKCALVGYFYSGVLQFYDVTNPASIKNPATYRLQAGYNGHVIDSDVDGYIAYIFVTANGESVQEIQVLDLSPLPDSPVVLGRVSLPRQQYGTWGKLRLLDDHLYFGASSTSSSDPGGLRVINVSDPANPLLAGKLNIPDIGHIPWRGTGLDIVERGWCTHAYMVGRTAFHVIDVSRPDRPKLSASYPLPRGWGHLEGGNVIVRDGLAYVAASRGDGVNGHGGLAIYRVAWY